jgi:uncharacterized 2Fe-2S/4Fe-4S cluster protein (DUF4445 family)
MPEITFVIPAPGGEKIKALSVERGISILEAARRGGVKIETPCNGLGTCGKCKVETADTRELVLACQTIIEKDASYIIRDYEHENKSLRILSTGTAFEYEKKTFISKKISGGNTIVYGGGAVLGIEEGDSTAIIYGLAVDIGTTTIVVDLIDIQSGKSAASESALNPQSNYAQDVLGRIHFAGKDNGLSLLYRAFVDILNSMIGELTKKAEIESRYIYEVVYSGNTTMLHLACNTDPSSLGRFPYDYKLTGACHVLDGNLNISPFALIYLPPVISAYVGADIVSGLLTIDCAGKKGAVLFIDIGTNGEMALIKNGVIAASSTAAGPAFEGMNILWGMRASSGAIEAFNVKEDGSYTFTVIGGEGTEASGICGSGLLDIAGELVRTGVIDKNGRFVPPEKGNYSPKLKERMKPIEGKNAFFITETVCLTQKDIRQIQLAKGAVRCGIEMLLSRFAVAAENVDEVIIAGSFGYHLNEKSLIHIGLLPYQLSGKISFAGNTSLSGAAAFLLNVNFRETMKKTAAGVDKVELAQDAGFERTFIKYMGF